MDEGKELMAKLLNQLNDDDTDEVWQWYALQSAIVATSRCPAATYKLLDVLCEAQNKLDDISIKRARKALNGNPPSELTYFEGIQNAIAELGHNKTATLYLLMLLSDAQRRVAAATD